MKSNNHQLIRCGLILELFRKQFGCTKSDLLRHFEEKGLPRVSKRTLERDFDLLRERFNVRIHYDHRNRWYVLDIPNEQAREQLATLIAMSALCEDLQSVIEVLEGATDSLLIRSPGQYTSPRYLFSVARSLKKKFSLRVEYRFIETRGTERLLVQPHLLIFEPGSWQLVAWIETEQHFVNLQLERIIHLEETQITFRRRSIDPLLQHHRPAESNSTTGPLLRFRSSESLYYRLVFQPPFHGLRMSNFNGTAVWEAQTPSESAAEQLIGTFLTEIDLIEPLTLRKSLVRRMENLLVRWTGELSAS